MPGQVLVDGRKTEALSAGVSSAEVALPVAVDDGPDVDLKHLFTKNDRRQARVPDAMIPDMLKLLKVQ